MNPVKLISTTIVLAAFLCHTGCKSDTDSTTQSGSQTQVTQSDSATQPVSEIERTDANSISNNEIFDKVRSIISSSLFIQTDRIQLDAQLEDDLGADELDKTDLVLALEKQLDITINDEDWDSVKTVNDVVEVVRKNMKAKQPVHVKH